MSKIALSAKQNELKLLSELEKADKALCGLNKALNATMFEACIAQNALNYEANRELERHNSTKELVNGLHSKMDELMFQLRLAQFEINLNYGKKDE